MHCLYCEIFFNNNHNIRDVLLARAPMTIDYYRANPSELLPLSLLSDKEGVLDRILTKEIEILNHLPADSKVHSFNFGKKPDLTRNIIELQTELNFEGLVSDPTKFATYYSEVMDAIMRLEDDFFDDDSETSAVIAETPVELPPVEIPAETDK